MTALQAPTQETRSPLPADLSPTGKLVYLYLRERGSTTVEGLKESLGVPQIRLYPVLTSLERSDLIVRSGDEFSVPR